MEGYKEVKVGDTCVAIRIQCARNSNQKMYIGKEFYTCDNRTAKNYVLNVKREGFKGRKLEPQLPIVGRAHEVYSSLRAEAIVHEDDADKALKDLLTKLEKLAMEQVKDANTVLDLIGAELKNTK